MPIDLHPIDVIRRTVFEDPDKVTLRWRTQAKIDPSSLPIPVTITSSTAKEVINTFGSVSSVASSATATIVSFTVPGGKTFFLEHIEVSGNNIAIYTVEVSSTVEAKRRTWFGGDISTIFNFSGKDIGLEVSAGTTIDVKVDNFRPSVGDFEGRILGLQE